MTARVWRDGNQIRKRVTHANSARRLISRTETLRGRGISTPAARFDAQNGTLVFRSITGTAGLALVADQGVSVLADLLNPLLALHQVVLDGLLPFEPEAKILPRLTPTDPAVLHEQLEMFLVALPDATHATAVHGDFHAGQLILDPSGTVWLLDLEDLATGAPESDLGNFAAHLATRPETRRGEILHGFEYWLGQVLQAYLGIGGICEASLARTHGRVALIRRALKLRERGDWSVLNEVAGP